MTFTMQILFTNLFPKNMKSKNLENFEKLVSNSNSGWLDKFLHYKTNQKWLEYSSKVAINVLEALNAKNMSQKDLAEKLKVSAQQVNKILKGNQNLTFETVVKLEDALGISLIEIIEFNNVNEIKTNEAIVQAMQKTISEEIAIEKNHQSTYSEKFIKKPIAKMDVVYNINKQTINYKPIKSAM